LGAVEQRKADQILNTPNGLIQVHPSFIYSDYIHHSEHSHTAA
jgi:hypothetical protein